MYNKFIWSNTYFQHIFVGIETDLTINLHLVYFVDSTKYVLDQINKKISVAPHYAQFHL